MSPETPVLADFLSDPLKGSHKTTPSDRHFPIPDILVCTPTEQYSSITPPPSEGSTDNEYTSLEKQSVLSSSPLETCPGTGSAPSDNQASLPTADPLADIPPAKPPTADEGFLPSPPPPIEEVSQTPYRTPLPTPVFDDEDELPPYSEHELTYSDHDLTYVTPLHGERTISEIDLTYVKPDSDYSAVSNSYSTSALEISHTPTHHDSARKVLSDSEINMISVHTPCDGGKSRDDDMSRDHENEPSQRGSKRRAELCTPTHPLSASDSQLHR